MSKKKRKQTNTFLQSKNKKNMMSAKQKSNKGKKLGIVHHCWDNKKRNVYKPTKEGLEMFLKEVGGNSPFYYKKGTDRVLLRQKKSNGYLWTMWREVMGLDNRTGVNNNLRTIEPFYWFAELEHLITNNEMFWTLINDVWCNKSEVFTDNPAILERYGRDKVSLEKKMECAEHLKIIMDMSFHEEHKSSKGYMLNLVEDDEITLYRSFKVEKGKSVRKGVKKKNNPDFHIQEEGRGWSYSINKTNSIFLNGLLGTFFYKKYLNMNDDDARKYLQKERGLSQHKMNDITLNCNFYNCIGIYSVKRKDIMFMTDDWGEMEVVVNPKNVKLLDYDFLNIYDFMTQSLVMGIVDTKRGFGDNTMGRSGVMNIDKFYAKCRRLVKKGVIDKPKSIIEYLKSNGRKGDWGMEVLKTFYEGDRGIGYLQYKDETDSNCRKYVIAHMDEKGGYIDYEFA